MASSIHKNNIDKFCRICQTSVGDSRQYVSPVSEIIKETLLLDCSLEEKGTYSSSLCKPCYNKLNRYKNKKNT